MRRLSVIVILAFVLASLSPVVLAQGDPCPSGTGPGGIVAGDYPPQNLTQDQRQWLFQVFGNSGEAPVGYGGQRCGGNTSQSSDDSFRAMVCSRGDVGPGGIRPGSYDPQQLSQEQRNWLYNQFGHAGEASVGYGGETCPGQPSNPPPNPPPPEQPPSGNAENIAQACVRGEVGPGGIRAGSYDPQQLSQEQRTWLYNQFGHSGDAPVGYGGEGCPGQSGNLPVPNPGSGNTQSGGQQNQSAGAQQSDTSGQQPTSSQQQQPQVQQTAHLDFGASEPIGDRSLRVIAGNGLNIRSGPGTDYPIIGRTVFGAYFAITGGPDGNWYKIRFNGGEGWVSAQWVEVVLNNLNSPPTDSSVPVTEVPTQSTGNSSGSNVLEDVRTTVDRVYGVYEGLDFAIDLIKGTAILVDAYCGIGGRVLSRIGDPVYQELLESTDVECVWLGVASGVLQGSPVGLVPALLYPEKYIDPWLDRVNEWAWSHPLTCTFFPNAIICGH